MEQVAELWNWLKANPFAAAAIAVIICALVLAALEYATRRQQ